MISSEHPALSLTAAASEEELSDHDQGRRRPAGSRRRAVAVRRTLRRATGTLTSGDPHCYDSGI